MARPAPDLENPCAVGGDRRDVVSDPPDERAEDEPTHGVVDGGVANENPSRHLSPPGAAAVPNDGHGCAGRSEQDDEPSRSTHHNFSCICDWSPSVGCAPGDPGSPGRDPPSRAATCQPSLPVGSRSAAVRILT
jgi:hypothetical protein